MQNLDTLDYGAIAAAIAALSPNAVGGRSAGAAEHYVRLCAAEVDKSRANDPDRGRWWTHYAGTAGIRVAAGYEPGTYEVFVSVGLTERAEDAA